ncbi:MAG TPA: ribbon-helix-helix protein, CopG family [Acidobacteriaceae bacterium]|nr:ribbon-helix-helix protein, CopG family [Acidobacteriaceae bacterium]
MLVEFPATLLKMADEAAAMLDKNRSELIRTAVEQYIERLKKKRLEEELASAYVANAAMNLEIAEDFANVDREGF